MKTLEKTLWSTWSRFLTCLVGAVLIGFLVPILTVVLVSFQSKSYLSFPPSDFSIRWYEQFLGNTDYQSAIWNSLAIGAASATLATIAGVCTALAVIRAAVPGAAVVSVLSVAPAVLPQIVLAIGLFPISVWLGLQGTLGAVILAHAVVGLPFPFITVCGALSSYSSRMEIASMSLGANAFQTFRLITFPMIRAAVVAGFIFAFAASLDELVLALFLSSPTTRTLPLLLWEQLNFQVTPEIAAAASVVLAVTSLLIVAAILLPRLGKDK
ncbi:ABC transporter permease [Mesorhizobium sp. LHD-90]|uniref:ABC transporter permease n=1 Tax=Mesorhizobium sp. LHD-90 TaxID=3071414 RepID=UPI0027E10458|nr:ABC transporter permease [Mesorhizobium sp. LHD-90]MDQ6434108.1 ABC transporter permease [Mesorhizobium sp. LHD-90]